MTIRCPAMGSRPLWKRRGGCARGSTKRRRKDAGGSRRGRCQPARILTPVCVYLYSRGICFDVRINRPESVNRKRRAEKAPECADSGRVRRGGEIGTGDLYQLLSRLASFVKYRHSRPEGFLWGVQLPRKHSLRGPAISAKTCPKQPITDFRPVQIQTEVCIVIWPKIMSCHRNITHFCRF